MSSTSPGVPGYETISVLADGPSEVVRARSLADGSEVTVKLLSAASEPILPKRFDRRRRALARLSESGRGYVPLIDHGTASDGRSFIVLPYLPLGSLQDQLDRGPTHWFPASQLLAKVAEAVGLAHEQDAPLGDLRPSKILLKEADAPAIAAFGMASRRFDDGRTSYRAPEADNDTLPTPPADVYSLALVLATIIAGRPKGRDETVDAFLAELVGLAPAGIQEVLEHGLAESVTNRYGNASAMHRALARAIDEGPEHQVTDGGDATAVDLDALLADPIPVVAALDAPVVERSVDEGLPADLDDLIFVGGDEDGDDPAADGDPDPDDRLLLPPGLDDIVLAPPSVGPAIKAEAEAEDDDTNLFPLAGDHRSATTDAEHVEPDLVVIDLTTERSVGDPGETDGAIDDDQPDDGGPETNGHVANGVGHDPNHDDDGTDDRASGTDGDGDDEGLEIVDLTELFTRTHEFVYDPEIHGVADRPSDETSRSGDGSTVTRPPGDPDATPSTTTTLLREAGSVSATQATDHVAVDDGPTTDVDEALDEAAPVLTPAPPQMPARDPDPVIDDDPTNIFPDVDGESSPPWQDAGMDDGLGTTNGTAPTFLDPEETDAIPFQNMGRLRNRVDDHRWHARARVRAELVWFRSRRTFGTLGALLGLLAIVAIVVLFAAREIRSATTSIDTEGVPQPLTTATTSANFLSTDAPFITDVPPSYQPTTATTARRRPATTSTSTSTTVTPSASPSTTAPATTTPPTTVVVTTPAPTTPTTRRTTTERESTTTERTTTTRRRRRTTTTVATTRPTVPTTTETTSPPTTEVLPTTSTTTDDDDDDGGANGRGRNAGPELNRPALVSLSPSSAAVSYSSDECVATQFRLAGTDGSVQSGSSRGFDAAIQCSSAWNLDFRGSSGLSAGVAYTLTLTVKGQSGETASGRLEFTTPA